MLCANFEAAPTACSNSPTGTCEHHQRNKVEEILESLYSWPAPTALSFPGSGLTVSQNESLEDVLTRVDGFDQATKDVLLQELMIQQILEQQYAWPAVNPLSYINGDFTVTPGDAIDDAMSRVAVLNDSQKVDLLRELQIQDLLEELWDWPQGSDFGFPKSGLNIAKENDLEDVMTNVKGLTKENQELLLAELKVSKEAQYYMDSANGGNVDAWLDGREQESINYNTIANYRADVKDAIIKKLLIWLPEYRWQADGVYQWDSVTIKTVPGESLEDFMDKVTPLTDDEKNAFLDELQSCDRQAPSNGGFGDCPASITSGTTCNPTCRTGLTPSPSYAYCQNGILYSPTCVAASCNSQIAPANGSYGNCGTTLASGTSCQPTCAAGYTVSGPHTCFEGVLTRATCNANACSARGSISDGNYGDCPASLGSGSTCNVQCNTGFSVSGQHSCNAGVLNEATCVPDGCAAPSSVENGGLGDCTAPLASAGSCQPTCGAGFTVSGQTTCLNGVLSQAACLPNACNARNSAPVNGFLGDCGATLASGGTCQPTCGEGYEPSGETKCNNGVLEVATCEPKSGGDDSDWWIWVIVALAILAALLILALILWYTTCKKCCGPGKQKVYVYRSHSQRMKIQARQEREEEKANSMDV
jgi:hypothetical protein